MYLDSLLYSRNAFDPAQDNYVFFSVLYCFGLLSIPHAPMVIIYVSICSFPEIKPSISRIAPDMVRLNKLYNH